ncbi:non-homologous end-joining DNA ligase [Sporichthya sp.]|uniref:non-homologous end-joining DNA ligase n=1 Tax=Sporichthya sp. TaxID=65475 RepID=UPI0025F985D6|nr:non-homologous end-joining DNA ligase [Sporichthya sp.]
MDELPADLLAELLDAGEQKLLRPAKPAFRTPMLSSPAERPPPGDDWVYERKLDGVRLIAVRGERTTRLYSRIQRDNSATFPEIVAALTVAAPPGLVVDGEVVAFDGEQTSFGLLQARLGISDVRRALAIGVPVVFYAFDLLTYGGQDLTQLPLQARRRVLTEAITYVEPLRLSEEREGSGVALLREACASGWEGLIAKRAGSKYEPGRRSSHWLKLKCVREQEFVIGGFTESSAAARTGFGALLVGYYEDGELKYAGKVGTGFDHKTLAAIRVALDDLVLAESPFVDAPKAKESRWVDPLLVAQVGFTEWTREGRLRHPRYLGLRHDKDARDVVREIPP